MEKLGEFLDRDQIKSEYEFQIDKKLEQAIYKANTFRMDIYQQRWEEAFNGMLKYLYDKAKADFYMTIDVHKMFRNIEIPLARELMPLRFYVDQLVQMIFNLRIKLYELKMNSMTRIKMPITANTDLVERIKNIYQMHIIIDNLMGDKLRYDQYIFIYNAIKFVFDSTQRDYLLHLKDEQFIKEAIPKYVILCAIIKMTSIVEKIREKCRETGEMFTTKYYDNFIQIGMPLEPVDSPVINAHEIENLKLTDETKKSRELLMNEIDELGRFWLMEGFVGPEDRALWMEAVEAMRNINFSVQNDIRDMLLTQFDEQSQKRLLKDNKSKDNLLNVSKRSSRDNLKKLDSQRSLDRGKHRSGSGKKKGEVSKLGKGKKPKEKEEKIDMSYETEDDSSLIKKSKDKVLNVDYFRPPFVWNYPFEKLKKPHEDERIELRVNDPRMFYKDGRVEKFLELLNELKRRMIEYKGGLWDYIIGKILPIMVYLNNANILPKIN